MRAVFLYLILALLIACDNQTIQSPQIDFGNPVKVTVQGYTGDLMEPFLSRNGEVLFFNNLNVSTVNTNIHWASKISDTVFEYEGEVMDINSAYLDGVASMDLNNKLYFVSTRSYDNNFSTIYRSEFLNGTASGATLVEGISRNEAGWVNFDVEISADGEFLYFVDGRFDASGGPYESDLVVARKSGSGFLRLTDQSMLSKVNTTDLEYAACISQYGLELYFTRVEAPITTNSSPKIYVTTRNSTDASFGEPSLIKTITGFAEGPTLSPDDSVIYYHQKENGTHVLYLVRKK